MDYQILYIDDDESLHDLFQVAVEGSGYAVDFATTGEDGLAMHAKQPYDLVATDYQLPGMTGVDVIRKLFINNPFVPVVMVTGRGNERVAAEALTLGAYNYIIKDNEDVFLELLPNVIDSALKRGAERYARIAAEKELSTSLERLNAIVSGSPVGITLFDKSGQCVFANDATCQIADGTREEILALNFHELDSWKQDGLYDNALKCLSTKKPIRHESKLTSSFNKEVILDCSLICLSENDELSLLLLIQDITDQKRAEQAVSNSEKRLRLLTDRIPGLVAYINKDLVYEFANASYLQWFGITAEEISGKTVVDVTGEKGFEWERDKLEEVLSGEIVRWEDKTTDISGQERYFIANYIPYKDDDGTVLGFSPLSSISPTATRSSNNWKRQKPW